MKDENETKNSEDNAKYKVKIDNEGFEEDMPNDRYKQRLLDSEDLLEKNDEFLMKEKLMYQPQTNSLFKIYCHFFGWIDWFFLFFAIIGSLGAGATIPTLMYISSDVFNMENTAESKDSIKNLPKDVQEKIIAGINESIKTNMNRSIKRQLIAGCASFVCNFLCGTFWLLIGIRSSHNFKKKYFKLILSQEQGWFDLYNTYELANKVQAQIETFEQGIGLKVGLTIAEIVQFISGLTASFFFCWKVSLAMLGICPIAISLYIILSKTLKKGIVLSRKLWENAGGLAEEIIYNIKTVASFANFDYELSEFNGKVRIVCETEINNTLKLGIFNGIIVFCLYLLLFVCFIIGRTLIGKDYNRLKGRELSGGDVYSAGLLTLIGLAAMGAIAPNLKGIQESCNAVSDYFNLCNRIPQMKLGESIQKPPNNEIQGKIEFKSVKFSYPIYQKLILDGINLTFKPGKKIALVGESGCGKSTIVNLIERLYDISEGELLIDGVEIKNYDIEFLRNFIGYVQQEPVLFNTSIRENIIFGREKYLSSLGNIDELIQNACDETYSTEFINNLNEGLDYIVGLKGNKLSGGQRQRIAIARAILAKPKILILDEATSSLDNISEKEVQKAIDNITQKNVTTIIIAHRLSTIKNADLIYVIKDGKVLEQGNHDQLLELDGYYSKMVKTEISEEMEIQNDDKTEISEKVKIKRTMTEEIIFEKRDNAISLSEKDISVRPCAVVRELNNNKCNIFLACLGAFIVGVITPIIGVAMAKTLNALKSKYKEVRYDDGLKFSIIFLGLAFIIGLGNCLMVWQFMTLGLILAKIYRKKLMAKYLSFHLSYFDVTKNSPGALLTKMSINTMELNQMLNSIFGITIQCGCTFIIGLIVGGYYEYRLILIDYSFIPIIIFFHVIRRQFIESSGKRSILANVEAGGISSECIINTKTIFSFNFQKEAIRLYIEIIDYIRRQFIRDALIMGLFMGLGNLCYFLANSCVYYAAKHFLIDGSMDSENMNIIMTIVNISIQQLVSSMGELGNLKKANEAFRAIYSTLETNSLIPPFKLDNEGKKTAINISGKIEFKNVTFAYPTRPENIILKNVSFTIEPGQQVGIVGFSGSGKSTIIQLINRFYDVEDGNGEILIDDKNIKEYNLYELRKKIGWVPQEPTLFKKSPLENIRYGQLDATDEECIKAAKYANIMKFFNEDKNKKTFETGFENSEISDKKDLMSGGEKQRLCIARVFLKNPTILLLDEVTSSLDKESELEVQNSLDKLADRRTCISISHRLNTIEKCHQIFVMENGKLIEKGTHQELMDLKQVYYTMQKSTL